MAAVPGEAGAPGEEGRREDGREAERASEDRETGDEAGARPSEEAGARASGGEPSADTQNADSTGGQAQPAPKPNGTNRPRPPPPPAIVVPSVARAAVGPPLPSLPGPPSAIPGALPGGLRPEAAARVLSAGLLSGDYGKADADMLQALEHLSPTQLSSKAAELESRALRLQREELGEVQRAMNVFAWSIDAPGAAADPAPPPEAGAPPSAGAR